MEVEYKIYDSICIIGIAKILKYSDSNIKLTNFNPRDRACLTLLHFANIAKNTNSNINKICIDNNFLVRLYVRFKTKIKVKKDWYVKAIDCNGLIQDLGRENLENIYEEYYHG